MRRILLLSMLVILSIIFAGCVNNQSYQNKMVGSDSYVYIIYSPTCPHCHNLIKFVNTTDYEVNIIFVKNTEISPDVLKSLGIEWHGGVPIMFGILENGTAIVVQGYPSESQDKDGYFLGKEYEENMCGKMGGEKIVKNNEYVFCKMKNGFLLGNENSVRYLLDICSKEKCKKVMG